jgi:hypothetical protein
MHAETAVVTTPNVDRLIRPRRQTKLHVIENVDKLRPELQFLRFIDLQVPEEADIKIIDPGP